MNTQKNLQGSAAHLPVAGRAAGERVRNKGVLDKGEHWLVDRGRKGFPAESSGELSGLEAPANEDPVCALQMF